MLYPLFSLCLLNPLTDIKHFYTQQSPLTQPKLVYLQIVQYLRSANAIMADSRGRPFSYRRQGNNRGRGCGSNRGRGFDNTRGRSPNYNRGRGNANIGAQRERTPASEDDQALFVWRNDIPFSTQGRPLFHNPLSRTRLTAFFQNSPSSD